MGREHKAVLGLPVQGVVQKFQTKGGGVGPKLRGLDEQDKPVGRGRPVHVKDHQ